jgi:hypothetical protein
MKTTLCILQKTFNHKTMKNKIKETKKTHEDKYLRLLIGDGKPFQERKDYLLYLLENIGGDKTVKRLCEALEKKCFLNPITRYNVIEILAKLSDDRVIELLLRIAKDDEDDDVRGYAIQGIGDIQYKLVKQKQVIRASLQRKIFSYFESLLIGQHKDSNEEIRLSAIYALKEFKCDQSMNILKQALRKEKNYRVYREIYYSLFCIEPNKYYSSYVNLSKKGKSHFKLNMRKENKRMKRLIRMLGC